MTERNVDGPAGWQAHEGRRSRAPDPFAEWYDAWRTRNAALRQAEEAERSRMRREIRWLSGLIVVWSLVTGGAAAFAIWVIL